MKKNSFAMKSCFAMKNSFAMKSVLTAAIFTLLAASAFAQSYTVTVDDSGAPFQDLSPYGGTYIRVDIVDETTQTGGQASYHLFRTDTEVPLYIRNNRADIGLYGYTATVINSGVYDYYLDRTGFASYVDVLPEVAAAGVIIADMALSALNTGRRESVWWNINVREMSYDDTDMNAFNLNGGFGTRSGMLYLGLVAQLSTAKAKPHMYGYKTKLLSTAIGVGGTAGVTLESSFNAGATLKYIYIKQDVDSDGYESYDLNRSAIALTVDAGKDLDITNGWFVKPSAEGSIIYLTEASDNTRLGKIKLDDHFAYSAEAGVTMGKELATDLGAITPYGRVAAHFLNAEADTRFAHIKNYSDINLFRGELTAGVNLAVDEMLSAHAAVNGSIGSDDYKGYGLTAGVACRF